MLQLTALTGGTAVYLLYVCLFSVVSGASRQTEIVPMSWWIFEVLGLVSTILPSFLPSDILRFHGAVFVIMCFLSIHSRICRHFRPYLWKLQTNQLTEEDAELFSIFNFRQSLFWNETLETIFYNAQTFVEDSDDSLHVGRLIVPFVHFLCTLFVGDGCVLVLFQVMPHYDMQYQDHMYMSGLLIGVWLYCALELAYVGHELLLFLCGCKLNKYMRHSTPIVSVTLSELWSIRWNPIIMKLLQSSFYIPLRQRGFHPVIAVLITFGGSAWLHAFPQFVHSFNMNDCAHVALFFIIHGVLVAIERTFIGYTTQYPGAIYPISPRTIYVLKRHSVEFEGKLLCAVNFLFFLSVTCYVSCYIVIYSHGGSEVHDELLVLLAVFCAAAMLSVVLLHHKSTNHSINRERTMAIIGGWLWTVLCLYLTLPLWASPAIKVLQSSYSVSFFARPVLRRFISFI